MVFSGVSTPVYEIACAGQKRFIAKVVRATKPVAVESYKIGEARAIVRGIDV